jgi:hypothetical protein
MPVPELNENGLLREGVDDCAPEEIVDVYTGAPCDD